MPKARLPGALITRYSVTRKATSLPSFVLIFTLCNFTIYTLYWALDVYILLIRYHSLISPEFKEGNGKSGIKHMSLNGAPSTEGIPPESFAMVYVQWVAGLTLVSMHAPLGPLYANRYQ